MIRNSGQFGILYLAAILVLATCIVPVSADNKLTVSGVILPPAAPVAAFSGAPTSGSTPLTVQFTDESTGVVTGYQWDFDNNGITDSTVKNPVHTYTAAGKYTIRLTVTGPGGSDAETKKNYITVKNPVRPPVAIFTQDKYVGRVPLTVRFTDRSLRNPTSWEWWFGDGTTSSQKNPVHTYTSPGIFIVRERVSNEGGNDTAYGIVVVLRSAWW